MKIYENFLPAEMHKNIYNQLVGPGFAWYNYTSVVDSNMKLSNKFYTPDVFRHCFVLDYKIQSPWINLLDPVLLKIKDTLKSSAIEVINAHANWMFPNKAKEFQVDYPHIDKDNFTDDCYTALYYFNDCEGSTTLYDQYVHTNADIKLDTLEVVSTFRPYKNKLLLWKAKQVHSGPAFITEPRLVFNINLRIKDEY